MAQLIFTYGTMASGKSIELLKVAHNYHLAKQLILLYTSSLDTRTDSSGFISSRIGLKEKANVITTNTNLFKEILAKKKTHGNYAAVLIDEAQFLKEKQVKELAHVVDELDIPVMAFGLRTDFQNNLFEGSKALFIYADKLEEMKTICHFCPRKAIMNLRINNGKPIYTGEQVLIGADESYIPVCRKHYCYPKIR